MGNRISKTILMHYKNTSQFLKNFIINQYLYQECYEFFDKYFSDLNDFMQNRSGILLCL